MKIDDFDKVQKIIIQLINRINDLEKRVSALESGTILIKKEELI